MRWTSSSSRSPAIRRCRIRQIRATRRRTASMRWRRRICTLGAMPARAICHLHGPYTVDAKIQPDGTKLSDLDIPGWRKLRDGILGRTSTPSSSTASPTAASRSARCSWKNSIPTWSRPASTRHDECFDYEPGREPVELYAIHDREELKEYCETHGADRHQARGGGLPLRRRLERHAHDGERAC